MASQVRGLETLQEQLQKTKDSLKDVDENIKRLTGRSPGEGPRSAIGSKRPGGMRNDGGGRGRLFQVARRGIIDERGGDGPPAKRRVSSSAFNRLGPQRVGLSSRRRRDSGDEDDDRRRPSIQSSVINASLDTRSRQETMAEQSRDSKGKSRNRRMFGLLLGTLQRFQHESNTQADREQRRRDIEKKLDEKATKEKEEVLKEKQELFKERRKKQTELKSLETKMSLVSAHEKWESTTQKLGYFIRTKAKPHIYYIPKEMIPSTIRKQQDTRKYIDGLIKDRKEKLEKELEEMFQEKPSDDEAEDGDAEKHENEAEDDDRRHGDEDGENLVEEIKDIAEKLNSERTSVSDDEKENNTASQIETGNGDEGVAGREINETEHMEEVTSTSEVKEEVHSMEDDDRRVVTSADTNDKMDEVE